MPLTGAIKESHDMRKAMAWGRRWCQQTTVLRIGARIFAPMRNAQAKINWLWAAARDGLRDWHVRVQATS